MSHISLMWIKVNLSFNFYLLQYLFITLTYALQSIITCIHYSLSYLWPITVSVKFTTVTPREVSIRFPTVPPTLWHAVIFLKFTTVLPTLTRTAVPTKFTTVLPTKLLLQSPLSIAPNSNSYYMQSLLSWLQCPQLKLLLQSPLSSLQFPCSSSNCSSP